MGNQRGFFNLAGFAKVLPRQLSKLLSDYGIKSKTVHFVHSTPKGFETAQFQDAFDRYLTPSQNVPPLRNDSAGTRDDEQSHVSDTEKDLY